MRGSEVRKRMIANEENPAPTRESTPEEEALLERSSAPTLRDLRARAKDLFTFIETDQALPEQED